MPATPPPAPRRLRVLQAVFDGDWELYRHFRQYLLIAAVWAAASMAASYALVYGTTFFSDLGLSDPSIVQIVWSWCWFLPYAALWLVPYSAIARVCFRSIVLSEPPTVARAFRFDGAFGRYLGTIVGIIAIVGFLIAIPFALFYSVTIFPNTTPEQGGSGPISSLVVLVIAMAGSPFVLALPIAAANKRSRPIRNGFRMGSGWRAHLFGVLLLGILPLLLLPTAWQWLFGFVFEWLAFSGVVDWILWLLFAFGWSILVNFCVIALAGAISSAYLQLTGPADRTAAPAPD